MFVDILFKGSVGGEKVVASFAQYKHVCTENDRSQCGCCVLPVIRCAFVARLDVGLAKRSTPCRFVGTLMFPPLFLGEDGRL